MKFKHSKSFPIKFVRKTINKLTKKQIEFNRKQELANKLDINKIEDNNE